MHFCNNCENMLYIRLLEEESDSLIYYCRNCGKTDDEITKENICVLQTDIVLKEKAYLHEINEYTKLDPTLPRTNNIKCPNQSCSSNHSTTLSSQPSSIDEEPPVKNDVIYLRYDDVNMKYIYICTLCDKIWKTSEQ
jgi:DNA-directed RNA polymerase subunit M/transcription elongation factor TFIIS